MFKRKLFRAVLLVCCLLIINAGNTQKEFADNISSPEPVIAAIDYGWHTNALQFVKAYLKKNKYGLLKLEKRSRSYFTIINSVFSKYDIPLELRYLAIVESGLKSDLSNKIGAAGIWQIMPSTALLLGLKITENSDERFHVYKSTKAIAGYLKQLYNEFGDWLLVVAAYNSGPGNVNRAIHRSGSHDFWQLQNWLPAETRNHVKKYISIHYYFESLKIKGEEKKYLKA